jgi:hypothetical protein
LFLYPTGIHCGSCARATRFASHKKQEQNKNQKPLATMAASNSSFTEVPVSFHDGPASVWVVSDAQDAIVVRRCEPNSSSNSNNTPRGYATLSLDAPFYRGCASVSRDGSAWTVAKPQAPWVVRVGRVDGDDVEIDLSQTKRFAVPAAVQIFRDHGCAKFDVVLLVDRNGAVLRLKLPTSGSETPSGELVETQQLVAARLAENNASTASLQRSQVAFLSPDTVVLALHPLLFTLKIEASHSMSAIAPWFLQSTRSKRRSRFSIVDTVQEALGLTGGVLDLPPCLAVAEGGDTSKDNNNHLYQLVSLHNDGALYQWTLPFQATEPTHVVMLKTKPDNALPPAQQWASDQPTHPLLFKLVQNDTQFILGVALQTQNQTETNIVVAQGTVASSANRNETEMVLPTMPLNVPGTLLQWEWDIIQTDIQQQQYQLLAMFAAARQQEKTTSNTMYCVYPPAVNGDKQVGNVMIEPECVEQPAEFLLDTTSSNQAESAFAVIQTQDNLADAIHAVDKQNMRRLFRSSQYQSLSRQVILQAIQKCVPGYRCSISEQTAYGVEVETLQAMQELRARQLQRKRMTLSKKTTDLALFSPNNNKPTANNNHGSTSLSLYEQLAMSAEPASRKQGDEDSIMAEEDSVEHQAKQYQQCWNALFQAIQEHQEMEKTPCLLKYCDDRQLLLLRPGTASVLITSENAATTTSSSSSARNNDATDLLQDWDKLAMNIVRFVEVHPMARQQLRKHEQLVWDSVARGNLAWGEYHEETNNMDHRQLQMSLSSIWDSRHIPNEYERVVEMFGRLSEADRVAALQNSDSLLQRSDLPGINLLMAADANNMQDYLMAESDDESAISNIRSPAASLTVRCLDSMRRLCLGRCLLLQSDSSNAVQLTSLRGYLHAVTCLWAAEERCNGPKPLGSITKRGLGSTVLDEIIHRGMADARLSTGTNTCGSLASSTVQLCKAMIKNCVGSEASREGCVSELGMIHGDAHKYPAIALRLLAPFVRLSTDFDASTDTTQRKVVLVECLLKECRLQPRQIALAMVQHAKDLLPFQVDSLEISQQRLALFNQNLVNNPVLAKELLTYLQEAMDIVDHDIGNRDGARDELMSELLSAKFNAALIVHEWDTATLACRSMSRRNRRHNLERLVRAMVENGDLDILLSLCGVPGHVSERANIEAYAEQTDFALIAAETLSRTGVRDFYMLKATDKGPFTDYLGALYSLYVSQGKWKEAAEVQNLVYDNAVKALGNEPPNLDQRTIKMREELIVKDLVSSAIACKQAIDQILNDEEKYVVGGRHGDLSTVSLTLDYENSAVRGRSPGDSSQSRRQSDKNRASRLTAANIELRAHLVGVLAIIYFDGSTDGGDSFARSLFISGACDLVAMAQAFDQLLARGYFYEALLFTFTVDNDFLSSEHMYGGDIQQEWLNSLISRHLLPLAYDSTYTPDRPTLRQLTSALDVFGDDNVPPMIMIGNRSLRPRDYMRSDIRSAAFELVVRITTHCSTARTPLALDVATCYLEWNPLAPLPQWLEELLVFGTSRTESIGLFAQFTEKHNKEYSGDPSALLSLYTKLGLYEDACRVVVAVLKGADPASRKSSAPTRFADQGKMDHIPREKVDILLNLIKIVMQDGRYDYEQLESLRSSYQNLEEALIEHFGLLKISAEGRLSAMAMHE